jgi:hypothetical protein
VRDLRLIIGVMALASSIAAAQTGQYTATLAEPLAGKKEFVSDGNIWRCEASTCVLASTPADPASVRTCHALERRAGKLTAYGSQQRPFDSSKLAACNAGG